MIEKYFRSGVRLAWHKPDNVDGPFDGAIVDSVRPTAPMRYIGLGGDWSRRASVTGRFTGDARPRMPALSVQ